MGKQEFLCTIQTNWKYYVDFSEFQLCFNGLFKKHLLKKFALYTYFFVKTNWTQNTASFLNLWNISNVKSALILWRSGWLAKKHTWSKISQAHKRQSESINFLLLGLWLIINTLKSNKMSSFNCSVSTLQYCVISLVLKPFYSLRQVNLTSESLK